jgi:hypothetical protein
MRFYEARAISNAMRATTTDRLLDELRIRETRLQAWIRKSEKNAHWFRLDPVGAMAAANLGIDEQLMCELKSITNGIAKKLRGE